MAARKRNTKRPPRYAPGSRAGVGGRKRRDASGPGKPLYVRLTAAERQSVEAAAKATGCEAQRFALRAVLEAAKSALETAGLLESA
jgi:hypothetical protein